LAKRTQAFDPLIALATGLAELLAHLHAGLFDALFKRVHVALQGPLIGAGTARLLRMVSMSDCTGQVGAHSAARAR
jgi:hypothetical protein